MKPATKKTQLPDPGSFRDPSGHVFTSKGKLYRQVNLEYKENFDYLISSGLYERLVKDGLLNAHTEEDATRSKTPNVYRILCPRIVQFVSYPYEWCFSQLKDAALTTLSIQKLALDYGMSLKDASSYNIQFVDGKPLLIDTLSFMRYEEGTPWVAYRQFCQHFLAPLALMSLRDARLGQMLRSYIDGIPLDLAHHLLPMVSRWRPGIALHIHLHALSQKRYAERTVEKNLVFRNFGKRSFYGLIDSLENSVESLRWKTPVVRWGNYYVSGEIDPLYLQQKRQLVETYVRRAGPSGVWDLGSNTGMFSRIVARQGVPTISIDSDIGCVEENYLETKRKNETNILPLLVDFTNPSPASGWGNAERKSLLDRGPVDLAMALALIHHLAIGNNVPMDRIASYFRQICSWLVIEFVPKSDPMVKKILRMRNDVFQRYRQEDFESDFSRFFRIEGCRQIGDSQRILYLFRSKRNVE